MPQQSPLDRFYSSEDILSDEEILELLTKAFNTQYWPWKIEISSEWSFDAVLGPIRDATDYQNLVKLIADKGLSIQNLSTYFRNMIILCANRLYLSQNDFNRIATQAFNRPSELDTLIDQKPLYGFTSPMEVGLRNYLRKIKDLLLDRISSES
jgi:hypothetical protein